MKFKYRIVWINTQKNKQEFADVNSQDIAVFIAKEKVYEGINIKNNLPKANKTQEVRRIG
jgi:hypothetical protein